MADALIASVLQQGTFRTPGVSGWSGRSCHSSVINAFGLEAAVSGMGANNPKWPGYCLTNSGANFTRSFTFAGDFTFEVWFDLKNFTGAYWQTLLGLANTSSGPNLYASSNSTSRLCSFYLSGSRLQHQNLVPASGLVHAVLQRTKGVLAIYLQGVKSTATYAYEGSKTFTMTLGMSSSAFAELIRGEIYGYRITNAARFTTDFDWTLEDIEERNWSLASANAMTDKEKSFRILSYLQLNTTVGLSPRLKADVIRQLVPNKVRRKFVARMDSFPWAAGRENIGINGTVAIKGTPLNTPVARPVYLYSMSSKMPVDVTMSNADGTYQFRYLNPSEKYYAVAFDPTGFYRPVIADNLPTQDFTV